MREFLRGCIVVVGVIMMISLCFLSGIAVNGVRSGRFATAHDSDGATDTTSLTEPPTNFNIFYEALGMLRDDFYGELPENEEVTYAAIRGVLRRLNDPGTILVEPEAHRREQEQFQGEFGGIGLEISLNEQGQVIVVSPVPETPAARADLRPDDLILEVDGHSVFNLTVEEVAERLNGEVGSEVTLLIFRESEAEPFEVTLERETIPDITVRTRRVEGSDVGAISISFFSARTPEELRTAIETLRAEGVQRYVLDLRNNPGGVLDAAIASASLFLDEGTTIAFQQQRDGSQEALSATGDPLLPEAPLIVLINGGSASASEVLAGALNAHDRATLVGSTSFGKGTVQIPYTLSNGASLHVTIAHWLTPDGIDLSQGGLTPDEVIESTQSEIDAGQDSAFDAAVDLLQGMN